MSESNTVLTVDLGDRSYPIYIGSNLLDQKDILLPHVPGNSALIGSASKLLISNGGGESYMSRGWFSDAADAPPAREWPENGGWIIGEPDLEVVMGDQYFVEDDVEEMTVDGVLMIHQNTPGTRLGSTQWSPDQDFVLSLNTSSETQPVAQSQEWRKPRS